MTSSLWLIILLHLQQRGSSDLLTASFTRQRYVLAWTKPTAAANWEYRRSSAGSWGWWVPDEVVIIKAFWIFFYKGLWINTPIIKSTLAAFAARQAASAYKQIQKLFVLEISLDFICSCVCLHTTCCTGLVDRDKDPSINVPEDQYGPMWVMHFPHWPQSSARDRRALRVLGGCNQSIWKLK